ncbi:MAG: NAD(P)H-hydrate epimerase [Planctomycetes bacterium]|nr:NAD(P)H-hydrate epimerase [Planctomycetota bacterium]
MKDSITDTMTREQVRGFDRHAIEVLKIPGTVLMENAGLACARTALSMLAKPCKNRVCILCGTGNNGGDGYVIARHLRNHGVHVELFVFGDMARVTGDALVHLTILRHLNVAVQSLPHDQVMDSTWLQSSDLLVDALLGTGLKGGLRGPYKQLIETINRAGVPVLAVDIPSGLDCDTGVPLGAAVKADRTVSLVALKAGFLNPDAAQYTGQVTVASIGVVPK